MGKRRITRESMIINFGTNYYVAGAFLSSCKASVHIHVFIDVGTEVQRGEMYDLTKIDPESPELRCCTISSCLALSKLTTLSEPPFLHLQKGYNKNTCFIGLS